MFFSIPKFSTLLTLEEEKAGKKLEKVDGDGISEGTEYDRMCSESTDFLVGISQCTLLLSGL